MIYLLVICTKSLRLILLFIFFFRKKTVRLRRMFYPAGRYFAVTTDPVSREFSSSKISTEVNRIGNKFT